MTSYVLSDSAANDIDDILDFIAADSVEAARHVFDDLDAAMQRLAEMPRIGHVRTEVAPNVVRFWVVHSYLIVYLADERPIRILRVISGFRDLVELLDC